jgi:hypothetical protein
LTFEPGQTERQITVPVLADGVQEGGEQFFVTLSDAGNAKSRPDAPPSTSRTSPAGIDRRKFDVQPWNRKISFWPETRKDRRRRERCRRRITKVEFLANGQSVGGHGSP